MRLLVWRVKTLKLRLTFLTFLLWPLNWNLLSSPKEIDNMTILETWDEIWASYLRRARQANAFDNQQIMLTVSDRIQIPSKTTHKDTGTKVNTYYYFIS